MDMEAKRFYQGSPATTATTVYTVPVEKTAIVKEIVICNTTGNDASVTLSVVPSGGSAGAGNRLLAGKVVPANDLVVLALSTVMSAGDFISVQQATANALVLTISGVEF